MPRLRLFLSLYTVYSLILIFRSSFVVDGVRYFTLFDDMMISMRYAKHLSQGHGLVWNLHQAPVEGFTNLLWTFIMALMHTVPHSPQTISLYIQLVALVCMVANLYFVWKILHFFTSKQLFVTSGMLLTIFYFPLNNWSIILGTEVSLLTLIITASAYLSLLSIKRKKVNPFIFLLLGIATLVRMDAIVPALVVIVLLSFYIPSKRINILITGFSTVGLFVAAQEFFRIMYFKDVLPNTFYLKMTGYPWVWRVLRGMYVLPSNLNWLLVLPVVFYTYITRNKYLLFILFLFLAQVSYSIYVGGDAWETMGGTNRYLTIVMPIFFCSFVVVSGKIYDAFLKSSTKKYYKNPKFLFAAWILIAFLGLSTLSENMLTQSLLITKPVIQNENNFQVKMARVISDITKPDAKIGVAWAGVVPYFTEREYLDLLGKNDKVIARKPAKYLYDPPRFFEHVRLFWPGHNKWDYDYILRQKPDMFAQIFPGKEVPKIEREGYTVYPNILGFYIKNDSKKVDVSKFNN